MEIKRTILLVVFSMSLVVLWDNWQRYNGKPSMFAPPAASQTAKDGKAKAASASAAASAASSAVNSAQAANPAAVTLKGERITITTDLVKAEIDTLGGELKHLELLKHKHDDERGLFEVLMQNLGKIGRAHV